AAHIALVDTALDVVEQNGARGKRRDGTTEVLVKGVIGELQAFLGAVGPQVAIHAAMYRLAMLVQTGAPRVVPQAAPVRLLLEADDFRDGLACLAGGFESAKLSQATGSCTDDGDTLSHVFPH